MAKNFSQLNYWRPRSPFLGPIFSSSAAAIGILPFVFALLTIYSQSTKSLLDNALTSEELWRAAVFTLKQATVSSLLVGIFSPIFGIGLLFSTPIYARASTIIRTLLFCLPSIVIATGIILAWGRNGTVSQLCDSLGLSCSMSKVIYSSNAIIFANVMMNLPFASLMIFRAICAIPRTQIVTSIYMGLSSWQNFSIVIWPAIRVVMLYFTGLTFLLSMSSFGALSLLGGGPESQTLEMGIYQSIYFNANWDGAALFAFAHTILSGTLSLVMLLAQTKWLNAKYVTVDASKTNSELIQKLLPRTPYTKFVFESLAYGIDLFVLIPVIAIFIDALGSRGSAIPATYFINESLIFGLLESLKIAIPTSIISTLCAWVIIQCFSHYQNQNQKLRAIFVMLGILGVNIVPAMSTAFGLLVIRSNINDLFPTLISVIGLHTVMTLPFSVNLLLPTYSTAIAPFTDQKYLLGLNHNTWIHSVELRIIPKHLLVTGAVVFALSINETAIVSMLGDPTAPVLTTTMIQLMGSYHFRDSAIGSCVLIIVTALAVCLSIQSRSKHDGDA